jgi:3-methyladenine DNA glycosylase AlkD
MGGGAGSGAGERATESGAGERAAAVLGELAAKGSEKDRAGMARYGINTERAFGVSVYELRRMAKTLGRDHALALALWETGNHEARILASMVDEPEAVTAEQMDAWAAAFDSWDVCDQVTSNLFDKTPYAWDKVQEWSAARDQWVKRAAFATAAALAVQDKQAAD